MVSQCDQPISSQYTVSADAEVLFVGGDLALATHTAIAMSLCLTPRTSTAIFVSRREEGERRGSPRFPCRRLANSGVILWKIRKRVAHAQLTSYARCLAC
jgi:hypothetical protein